MIFFKRKEIGIVVEMKNDTKLIKTTCQGSLWFRGDTTVECRVLKETYFDFINVYRIR